MIAKKTAQEQHQPGNVSDKLRRRMGEPHADVFNAVGTNLYNSIVLTIKNDLEELFKGNIDQLESTIKEELGNRGLTQAAEYFAPWILEVLEDVIQFGMKDVAGKLEELGNTAASKFVKKTEEEEEAGEEDLFGTEEEPEEVETVEEEPVAPPEEEETPEGAEEKKEEEAPAETPGLEELMAPPEGEAPAKFDPKPRVWKSKPSGSRRTASTYTLKVRDLVKAAGGKKVIQKKCAHLAEAFSLLVSTQEKVAPRILKEGKFSRVRGVNPVALFDWTSRYFTFLE